MNQFPQTINYLIIIAYAILFCGILIMGIGWTAFKFRALQNKPAWDGIGGKLIKWGLLITIIGGVLTAIALYQISSN
ncbi:hypothetical protein [Nicoliella lavandulae]|uniref:Uncharacterized protein n=1 Tax=Nicoliella lavandulae TaxID=3082954 RepID=A0ABU8SMF1_9LACO